MAVDGIGPDRFRRQLAAVVLLSTATLAYEVLLVRLFAIVQWHHFAAMIISLALLGYGVSGSFLAAVRPYVRTRFADLFTANAGLFGISAPACFFLAQAAAFNPLELPWESRQMLRLIATYVVLALPFFFTANAIGLALQHYREQIGTVYATDLLGAGVGSLGVVGLLFVLPPLWTLTGVGLVGLLAAAVGMTGTTGLAGRLGFLALGSALFLGVVTGPWAELCPSPYKDLSQALRVSGARIVLEAADPLGTLTVVSNREIPIRHAPGMSLMAPKGPPEQLALFVDGGSAGVIDRHREGAPPPAYLAQMTSALPYELQGKPKVLVLGAGGGTSVLQALAGGATHVDAVEYDAKITQVLDGPLARYSGHLTRHPAVVFHVAEARAFAAASGRHWDVIQLSGSDSFGATSTGLGALGESPLFTVEGLGVLLRRLAPDGILAITHWIKLPPRDSLKLLTTAVQALERAGIDHPGQRMAMVRSWKTTTLILKNGPLTTADTAAVRRFTQKRGFDLVYLPGITEKEANRYNRLQTPIFYEGAQALLKGGAEAKDFQRRYRYNIEPATDDRPYFFNFFRWGLLPELMAAKGRGGLGQIEWGYPVAAVTLAQAIIVAVPLILGPLWIAARIRTKVEDAAPDTIRAGILVYFLAIGLAFMFLEVAFLHRLTVFLGHPVLATAVVLAGFLVFAGLGARMSIRFTSVRAAVAIIGCVAFLWLLFLEPLFEELVGLPTIGRAIIALSAIAPLALFMGVPFPVGLSRLGESSLLPWAWAINGCASVIGALAASLLAVTYGYSAVIAGAVVLYGLAAMSTRLFFPST